MSGCLDFGAKSEFLAPNVTDQHLSIIEKRTGIKLPEGSIGQALYSDASGIDPWMIAKIQLPNDKVDDFRKSEQLRKEKSEKHSITTEPKHTWWTPGKLESNSSGQFMQANARVTWFLGREVSNYILFLRWDTF
ncbi:MAG: hypothetical protein IPK32_00105 [Verrucomicrobiaceae bacterium]|nr:hypothetical protein [Verrucomicrobiaceae bacterium]